MRISRRLQLQALSLELKSLRQKLSAQPSRATLRSRLDSSSAQSSPLAAVAAGLAPSALALAHAAQQLPADDNYWLVATTLNAQTPSGH